MYLIMIFDTEPAKTSNDHASIYTFSYCCVEKVHQKFPLQLLLSMGADVNCIGREEETPLHLAARWVTSGLLLAIMNFKAISLNNDWFRCFPFSPKADVKFGPQCSPQLGMS